MVPIHFLWLLLLTHGAIFKFEDDNWTDAAEYSAAGGNFGLKAADETDSRLWVIP